MKDIGEADNGEKGRRGATNHAGYLACVGKQSYLSILREYLGIGDLLLNTP